MPLRSLCPALLAAAMTALPITASASEYYTLSSKAFEGEVLNASGQSSDGAYFVSANSNNGLGPDTAWTQTDIDDDWYQIKVESLGNGYCLTLADDEYLGTAGWMSACEAGNLRQAWRDEEAGEETARLYNGAMDPSLCLTAVNTGHDMGSLTMTECGTGDATTEIWHAKER